jgi:hemerythrin-like domain-containing protein
VCEHCGCKQVAPIGELMQEHVALLDDASLVRGALGAGDRAAALTHLNGMVGRLARHVRREEDGIFTALRDDGEYAEEVAALEGEHLDLDAAIARLQGDAPDFEAQVSRLLDDLAEHVEREDLGIFPVSVVTLGAAGWELVEKTHDRLPTFLKDERPRVP